jgi:hypothetical protein
MNRSRSRRDKQATHTHTVAVFTSSSSSSSTTLVGRKNDEKEQKRDVKTCMCLYDEIASEVKWSLIATTKIILINEYANKDFLIEDFFSIRTKKQINISTLSFFFRKEKDNHMILHRKYSLILDILFSR